MKYTSLFKKLMLPILVLGSILVGVNQVQAAQIPYVPGQKLQTSQTPVFNPFTNIPAGVGDESDFVKLRKSSGDPTVPAATNNFIDPVNATCTAGEKFDIRTYIHNGADDDYNQNGAGSAVAHNVNVAMTAPLGQTSKKFTFSSTISASNAASVTDQGTLNCTNEVQLKLVPQSVKVYAQHLGWNSAADGSVNGNLKVGSRVAGSGDQWGCWEDRIVVVYVVEVVAKPQPPAPVYTCDAITAEKIGDRKYRFGVRYTATNGATLKSVNYIFGDNNSKKVEATPFTVEHEYAKAGEYKITTNLVFTVDGEEKTVTDAKCATTIKTSVTPCPTNPNLPIDSPDCKEVPKPPVTTIPSTGVGGILAGLTGTTAAAYSAYAYYESRRNLKKQLVGLNKNIVK
ncbi:MAG: hypothetical protein QG659_31 [Patescibacteria group bacterium]|jgi:hypothetical protein|nr:hypothetical protein [Patescibacteria group bacterium]